MTAPTSLLHGPSTSGSAAAPASEPPTPVPIVPANMMPRPSSARRSSRPLPATTSGSCDLRLDCLLAMGFLQSNPVREADDEIVPVGHLHLRQRLRVHHIVLADELVEREDVGGQRIDFVIGVRPRLRPRHRPPD